MSPTPRGALAVGVVALAALVLPPVLPGLVLAAVLTTIVVDAFAARRAPEVTRTLPPLLSRGIASPVAVTLGERPPGRVRIRQATPPDVTVTPGEADGELHGVVVARRRGRHVLPAVALRAEGPLGLGSWHHRLGEPAELLVYPDLPTAFRLALAVRRGRFRESGRRSRGPLGLGTDFESIREYVPDDDVRQINWSATARLGRPMSNQYRVEQDRDVICVVDAGRLMAAPLGDRTRLDAAVDAVAAVAAVADEVGDRCGVVAFDSTVARVVEPRRKGSRSVIRAVFDLEPSPVDSDYELAFHAVGSSKRALVVVFTDLLEEAAAQPLVDAVPVLTRTHAVVIASSADTDLDQVLRTEPQAAVDVYAQAVTLEVLAARERVAVRLRHAGADVLEAPPDRLAAACVGAYLRAKARARV